MRIGQRVSIPATSMTGFVLKIGLIVSATIARADEPARPPEDAAARAKATELIENMVREREKLVSAIVHVQGGVAHQRETSPPARTIRSSYAFDHSLGALRFDSTRRMQIQEQDVDADVIYLRTRDVTVSWRKPDGNSRTSMNLQPPQKEMGGGDLTSTQFLFDLRACGIMSQYDFAVGAGKEVKEYCDALLKLSVISVAETDRLTVILLRSQHADHRLTIDTTQQFIPVEYHMSWKKGPANSSDGSRTSRVTWMEFNGIMVPRSFSLEFDFPGGPAYEFANFLFLWKAVNQPIDKSHFNYKSFPDIPDGTDVVDSRGLGKVAHIGFWTKEGVVGPEDDPDDGPDGTDPTKPQPGDAKNEQTLAAGTQAGQERDDNGLKMSFVWCPPGKFVMGSPPTEPERSDGEDQVEVVLTRGFWIGKYEVTQGEWSQLKTPLLWKGRDAYGVKDGDKFPAMYLSWENAMAFCRKLTRQERAAGRLPPGWQYTLPTNAQWEYACRAGTTTRFTFGDDIARLEDYAWFRENTWVADERYAHVVGQKKPNPWGIYDMYGNVSEWCRDGWQKKLPGGTDPIGPYVDDMRVVRGGYFNFPSVLCRSAYCDGERARDRLHMFGSPGMRVVLCPVEAKSE